MTNLEKQILNTIENADNYMRVFHKEFRECSIHNEFTLLVEPRQISLIDFDEVVLVCDRGYIQLSQIVPLISDIVKEWGYDDSKLEIK